MEKRINERKVMKEVFACDYVYTCDHCGKEKNSEWYFKVQIPDNGYMNENPMFCSIACMKAWLKSDEVNKIENRNYSINDDDAPVKNFYLPELTALQLHELLA